jgi:hypothetical protein
VTQFVVLYLGLTRGDSVYGAVPRSDQRCLNVNEIFSTGRKAIINSKSLSPADVIVCGKILIWSVKQKAIQNMDMV